MSSVRTFIAFDTPDAIREEILALQSTLKQAGADVRWESSEKFHVTIKFLGDVDEHRLPDIFSKIEAVTKHTPHVDIGYTSVGCFPNRKNPRILWVGCENTDGRLELLKTRLDIDLLPFGFEIEQRGFHPHVTLGRVKSPRGLKNLTPMLESLTFQPHNARIEKILFMKSKLKQDGSEYSILKEFPLQFIA